MALMTDAFNRIRGISTSYLTHPAMLRARSVATQLARSPHVLGGSIAGTIAGGSYASFNNDPRASLGSRMYNVARGGLIGTGMGALGGAAFRGYGMVGGRAGLAAYGRRGVAAARGGFGRASSMASDYLDKAKYYAGL